MNIKTMAVLLIAIVLCMVFIAKFLKGKKDFYALQAQRVQGGGYRKQSLLNETEKQAYKAILDAGAERKLRVFAQVSLGEILRHQDYRLYKDIMSKRVDFLLTDAQFNPVMAIEIHGSGHYGNHAEQRDQIKQSALGSAGIEYVSVITNGARAYQEVFQICQQHFSRL